MRFGHIVSEIERIDRQTDRQTDRLIIFSAVSLNKVLNAIRQLGVKKRPTQ